MSGTKNKELTGALCNKIKEYCFNTTSSQHHFIKVNDKKSSTIQIETSLL